MTSNLLLILATSLLAAACATDDNGDGTPVDPSSCGDERLDMSGAFDADTASVSTVTIDDRIVGVGGFGEGATTSYALTVVDIVGGELATVGTHDVTAEPIKYLVAPASGDCQAPGSCTGFIARSGTFEVHQASPYRATFVLGGLSAYDGSTTNGTQTIAGQVTGCIAAVR